MSETSLTAPVAVSVDSIRSDTGNSMFDPYSGMVLNRRAMISLRSGDGKFSHNFETNILGGDWLRNIERLHQYGFTIVRIPEHWFNEYSRPHPWLNTILTDAFQRISQQEGHISGEKPISYYDEALAQNVLILLNGKYPHTINMIELKAALNPEPSDDELLTVLQGLSIESYIFGNGIADSQSGKRKLATMLKIRITKEGREHLTGKKADAAVVNQYNNYGHSGAMGPQAVGTINIQQQWIESASKLNLSQMAAELETLRLEFIKSAKTQSDFEKLALIAEAEEFAEKHDGAKVMDALSKSGKWLFDFATDVGTELAAKLIAKATGLEP
jgi:hypothetical protein